MIDTPVASAVHTAIVHAPDGVLFLASGADDSEVAALLVGYISRRCDDMLWPAAARAVGALIATGRDHDAIAAYFANVGQRWDEERLEMST